MLRLLNWLDRNAAWITILLAVGIVICIGTGLTKNRKLAKDCSIASEISSPEQAKDEKNPEEPMPTETAKYFELSSNIVYETAQVFLLNMSPRPGEAWYFFTVGRFLAVILFILVSFKFLNQLLKESLRNFRLSLWWIRGYFGFGHHIVCGLGRVGWPIIKQLLNDNYRVLVIERDPQNELMDDARKAGAIVIVGDASEEEWLKAGYLKEASALYVVTGNDTENLEVVIDAKSILKSRKESSEFQCYVHITDPNVDDYLLEMVQGHVKNFPVQPFSASRNSARQLIVEELTPIRPKITDDVALYVIVGFEAMGQTIATHLAELAHFENFKRSRLLILAENPSVAADTFLAKYGQFSPRVVVEKWSEIKFATEADKWADKSFRPAEKYRVENPSAIEYACNAVFAPLPKAMSDRAFSHELHRLIDSPRVRPAIIVCGENDQANFNTATGLERQIRLEHGRSNLPIFVWIPRDEPLYEILLDNKLCIRPFGSCKRELKLETIHKPLEDILGLEIMAAYPDGPIDTNEAAGFIKAKNQWMDQSETLRHSNRMAGIHYLVKIGAMGFDLVPDPKKNHPRLELDKEWAVRFARMEHNRWMAERLLAGWSYGPGEKTIPRRPHFCTWEELQKNEDIKKDIVKDFIPNEVLTANLRRLGFALVKKTPKARCGE